ncbi:MAG TPA: DUF4280 domain-containing protein [Kineosporiaceae bacterium]|nr:DUF4280 domain-containing protein [Kineosporiaceae bacterium]
MSPQPVVTGAILECGMGTAPSVMVVLPVAQVLVEARPVAVVADNIPFLNLLPFGMCQSPANPMVMAATAAALGVLTPMPCLPMPVGPWNSQVSKTLVGGKAVLGSGGTCSCAYGGSISIKLAGAMLTTAS